MRILSEEDVERLIDPAAAIATAADGYRRNAGGAVPAPGRLDLARTAPEGSVLVLAGHSDNGLFAMKANMHVYPDVQSRNRKAASMMLLWDAVRCAPSALIATTAFNNHRTAAGLAAAAQALAPAHAETLAVFGAGKIAPAVIRYLATIRRFSRIWIVGREPQRSAALSARLQGDPEFAGSDVRATPDADIAVHDADVVVTITTSDTPVFRGTSIKPGALVMLAGANRPTAREADDDLIARAQIYVDHRDSCVNRAGDLRIPLANGRLKAEQIVGEIGELLTPRSTVCARPAGVTVFKSIGIIAQDLALAEWLVARAGACGAGIEFDPNTGACSQAVTAAAHGAEMTSEVVLP